MYEIAPHKEELRKAIKMRGGQEKLSKELGISRKRLNNWLNRDKKIPYHFAVLIEQITQGAVTAAKLAPYAVSNHKSQQISAENSASPYSLDHIMNYIIHVHEDLKKEIKGIYKYLEFIDPNISLIKK